MKEVSKTVILPLTVLMHYDDIPTTDCRPSKNPFTPHFVGWMECNQTFSTLWLPRTGTVICGWGIGWLMAVSHQPSIGTLQTGKVVVARYWNGQCHLGWKAFKKSIKNLFPPPPLEAESLSVRRAALSLQWLKTSNTSLSLTATEAAAWF